MNTIRHQLQMLLLSLLAIPLLASSVRAQGFLAPEIAVYQSSNTAAGLIDGSSSVSFESSRIGSSGNVRTFVIKNVGTAVLAGLALTVDGEHAADFTVSSLETKALLPDNSVSFTVNFRPSDIGLRFAALHIASNDADENPFDISLTGTGLPQEVPAPEIAVYKTNNTVELVDGSGIVGFETVKIGSAGATQTITIRNIGNAVLSDLAITVDGDHAADFTVSTLEATTVSPAANRSFTVTFKPSAVGTRTAYLHIANNDSNENPYDIGLTGTGAAPEVLAPEISVFKTNSTASLVDGTAIVGFDPVKIGSTGRTQTLTIRNVGNAGLTGLALTVDGENAADFTVSALEATTLAPGASRSFNVTFIPGAIGTRAAALHIASNDADENPFDIQLTGSGVAPEVLSPEISVYKSTNLASELVDGDAKVSFGSVRIGNPGSTQTFFIRNIGMANLTGLVPTVDGEHAAEFTVAPLEATTVAPNATRYLRVTFKPTGVGTRTAALHIASNDANENPFDIQLTGTGLAPEVSTPEIAVFRANNTINLVDGDARLGFDSVKVGSPGVIRTLTIRNLGKAALTGLALTVDGENAADFTVPSLESTSIAPGGIRSFKITFKPRAVGARNAVLRIASNDADENPFDIKLVGTGLANTGASLSSLQASAAPVVSTVIIEGRKYRCITIEKTLGFNPGPGDIQVSSDLVHWFSGPQYTVVMRNDASVLRVRDKTPCTLEAKRYIRLRPRR